MFPTLNQENTERNDNSRAHPPDPLHAGIRRNQQRTSWILCISPKAVTLPLSSYHAARSTYQTQSKHSKILRQWQPTSTPVVYPSTKKSSRLALDLGNQGAKLPRTPSHHNHSIIVSPPRCHIIREYFLMHIRSRPRKGLKATSRSTGRVPVRQNLNTGPSLIFAERHSILSH